MDRPGATIQLEAGKEDTAFMDDVDGGKKAKDANKKVKGRGATDIDLDTNDRYVGESGEFQEVPAEGDKSGPQRSIEGWIVFVTGLHEETAEDDVRDKFADFGEVRNLSVPLNRRTGFAKLQCGVAVSATYLGYTIPEHHAAAEGYALVEYETKVEAAKAIQGLNATKFRDQVINVDWAFSSGPIRKEKPAAARR